jgi:hypothetical protein
MSEQEIQNIVQANTALRNEVTVLKEQLALLQEQYDWLKKQVFGRKSEQTSVIMDGGTQLSLFPEEKEQAVKKSCARVFQALRIDVNSEFEVLYSFLEKLPGILKPGGRAAILTFHSGEDRLVKKSFKELAKEDKLTQGDAEEALKFFHSRLEKMIVSE